jgi:hypothetical protein
MLVTVAMYWPADSWKGWVIKLVLGILSFGIAIAGTMESFK